MFRRLLPFSYMHQPIIEDDTYVASFLNGQHLVQLVLENGPEEIWVLIRNS